MKFCCSECVFHHPPPCFISYCFRCVTLDANGAPPVLPERPEFLMHISVPLPHWGTVTSVRSLLPFSPPQSSSAVEQSLRWRSSAQRQEWERKIVLIYTGNEEQKILGQQLVVKDIFRGWRDHRWKLRAFLHCCFHHRAPCTRSSKIQLVEGCELLRGKRLLMHPCLSKHLGLILPQYFLTTEKYVNKVTSG